MGNRAADRWSPGIALSKGTSGPMQAIGGFFAMSADAFRFDRDDLQIDRALAVASVRAELAARSPEWAKAVGLPSE